MTKPTGVKEAAGSLVTVIMVAVIFSFLIAGRNPFSRASSPPPTETTNEPLVIETSPSVIYVEGDPVYVERPSFFLTSPDYSLYGDAATAVSMFDLWFPPIVAVVFSLLLIWMMIEWIIIIMVMKRIDLLRIKHEIEESIVVNKHEGEEPIPPQPVFTSGGKQKTEYSPRGVTLSKEKIMEFLENARSVGLDPKDWTTHDYSEREIDTILMVLEQNKVIIPRDSSRVAQFKSNVGWIASDLIRYFGMKV